MNDPALRGPLPLIDTHWTHAGNYDSRFLNRWPRQLRLELPIRLMHLGLRNNWLGLGNAAGFTKMQEERVRRGGRWDHERIPGTPVD